MLYPSLRTLVLILWTLALLSVLSTDSYSAPTAWWGRWISRTFMPAKPKSLGWRYSDQSNFDHNQQAIYVWYPHGHLGIGAFGSIALGLGDDIWRRPTSLCAAPPFFDIPALKQLSLGLGLVRSDELNMRASLRQGNSLMVLPGGVTERNMAEPKTMKLVDGRRGFLRIARDLRLPLIPVFAFGENEFFNEPAKATVARDLMGAWHGSLDLPSWSTMKEFISGKPKPLKVCLGPAFLPTDFTKSMTQDWKMHVGLTYELCKPADAPPLEWISAKMDKVRFSLEQKSRPQRQRKNTSKE